MNPTITKRCERCTGTVSFQIGELDGRKRKLCENCIESIQYRIDYTNKALKVRNSIHFDDFDVALKKANIVRNLPEMTHVKLYEVMEVKF